jgi:hypothetical protein
VFQIWKQKFKVMRMDETRIIRGRRVVFERPDPVETLRYSLDVFDARDNLVEVLGRLADLSVAQAAHEAALKKYPDKRICLRQTCRVIRSSDRDR